jgi:predicted glycosyltransferase
MARISFELKFPITTLKDAEKTVIEEISTFLDVTEEMVLPTIDVEYKVRLAGYHKDDPETDEVFWVTAFATVKNSILKPM